MAAVIEGGSPSTVTSGSGGDGYRLEAKRDLTGCSRV
jgi:hypothetical protein